MELKNYFHDFRFNNCNQVSLTHTHTPQHMTPLKLTAAGVLTHTYNNKKDEIKRM